MKKYISLGLLLVLVGVFSGGLNFVKADDFSSENSSSCTVISYNMKYQSKDIATNGAVSVLQDFLQSQNYVSFEPSGYFGLMTVAGVRAFQSANGLTSDGSVGPITRAKINSMNCGGNSASASTFAPRVYIPPTNYDNGCPKGAVYNTRTGEKCGNIKYPSGCSSLRGYSTTTGFACDGTRPAEIKKPTYPPGCSSHSGYSSVDGMSCDGSLTGSIGLKILKITSSSQLPNAKAGNQYTHILNVSPDSIPTNQLSWLVVGGSLPSGLYLTPSDYGEVINGTPTEVGSHSFTLSATVPSGNNQFSNSYAIKKFYLTVAEAPVSTDLIPVISYLQGAGCTSKLGSSYIDGDFCSGVALGGTVYIFGSNFDSDAKISIGGGSLMVTPVLHSSSSMSFKVPVTLAGEPTIEIIINRDGQTHVSNNVALPLQPI